jgi:small subunit ribosomal protein S16
MGWGCENTTKKALHPARQQRYIPASCGKTESTGREERFAGFKGELMSVKIRLTRTGGRNDICYRVVATDSRFPRDGRFLEILGWYDPKKKDTNFSLKMDRINFWKEKGALVSQTVNSLIVKAEKAQA